MTVVGNLKVQEYIQNIRIFNLVLLKSHKFGLILDKNQRNLENEILYESGVEDIDEETLRYYKFLINADDLSNEKVLIAKGFLK